MDGRKAKRQKYFKSVATQLIYGKERKQETGDYRRLSNRPHRIKAKITNWQTFEEFADKHGDKTQAQMAQLWEEPISTRTISRGLKKIDFTRKKRIMDMKKEMKTEETNSKLK